MNAYEARLRGAVERQRLYKQQREAQRNLSYQDVVNAYLHEDTEVFVKRGVPEEPKAVNNDKDDFLYDLS